MTGRRDAATLATVSGRLVTRLVLLVAAAAVAPADAGAGVVTQTNLGSANGLNYREAEGVDLGPGAERSIHADCAAGHAVTGGGVFVEAPAEEARLTATAPFDLPPAGKPKDAWLGGAHNIGIFSRPLHVFAICRMAGAGDLAYRSDSRSGLHTGSAATLKVPCPDGSAVVGGGAIGAGAETWVNASQPFDGSDADSKPDDGWKGTIFNDAGFPVDVEADAVCTSAGVGALHYRKGRLPDVPAEVTGFPAANCQADEAVIGGGASISGSPASGFVSNTHPLDQKGDPGSTPEDGWAASTMNVAGGDKDMTAYAICKG